MTAHNVLQAVTAEQRRVAQDAHQRLFRCTGCGDWRYRFRIGRWHREQPPCPSCGAA